jgi:hypothetical protein
MGISDFKGYTMVRNIQAASNVKELNFIEPVTEVYFAFIK